MTLQDPLATGTILYLDGRSEGTAPLSDADALEALLLRLAERLEDRPERPPMVVRVSEPDGVSLCVPLDEAHLILHAFPESGRYALTAFSRHALRDEALLEAVRTAMRAGRSAFRVGRRAAGLPRTEEALARRLRGERAWARVRLAPLPDPD